MMLFLEMLESRLLPSALGWESFSPQRIRNAYSVVGDGAGAKIAIVAAYGEPSIGSDLHTFDVTYSLPDPILNVASSAGAIPPATGTWIEKVWADEIALDVEWAHAIAPKAELLLVVAPTESWQDLLGAVAFAQAQPGVNVVSMSWALPEFDGEHDQDYLFANPSVAFVASVSDNPGWVTYPSIAPGVLSVGATDLNTGFIGPANPPADNPWLGEIITAEVAVGNPAMVAWAGGANVAFPTYQSAYPHTFAVGGNSIVTPWFNANGTSAGTPQWAAVVAIADGQRLQLGYAPLGSLELVAKIGELPTEDFNAGLSPRVDLVVSSLVGVTHFGVYVSPQTIPDLASPVIVMGLDSAGRIVPSYLGSFWLLTTDPASPILTCTFDGRGWTLAWTTFGQRGEFFVVAIDVNNRNLFGWAIEEVI